MAISKRKKIQDVMRPSELIANEIEEVKTSITDLNDEIKKAKVHLKELEKDYKDAREREEAEAHEMELMTIAALIQKSGYTVDQVKEKLELN